MSEPEPSGRDYHARGHYEEVLSRRTREELQALLDERIAAYRSYRTGFVGIKLKSGEQVLTRSNNATTPFPAVNLTTSRRATATVRKIDTWLVENARREAVARADPHGAFLLGALDIKNLSPSDKDFAEEYLFGSAR